MEDNNQDLKERKKLLINKITDKNITQKILTA
jgi:hypothetical protein